MLKEKRTAKGTKKMQTFFNKLFKTGEILKLGQINKLNGIFRFLIADKTRFVTVRHHYTANQRAYER